MSILRIVLIASFAAGSSASGASRIRSSPPRARHTIKVRSPNAVALHQTFTVRPSMVATSRLQPWAVQRSW